MVFIKSCIDTDPYATHQKFLAHYIMKTTGDIIEFGTGHGSTGFILDLIKDTTRRLISVENNKTWFDDMNKLYPESSQHTYVFADDWQSTISSFNPQNYSIVFIDQAPWEARKMTLDHFKNESEYVIVHDVDYFAVNNMFGKVITQFEFDFSDCFKIWKVYYPSHPWPAPTGPPTLVGSNFESSTIDTI